MIGPLVFDLIQPARAQMDTVVNQILILAFLRISNDNPHAFHRVKRYRPLVELRTFRLFLFSL